MGYRVRFTHRAEKTFSSLPQKTRIRIEIALERFAANPFHHQDEKKVSGCPVDKPLYRMRIGDYRAAFRLIQDLLVVCDVAVGKKRIVNIDELPIEKRKSFFSC